MSRRRKYSPEFKREAIALTRQPGVSCRQVALGNWYQSQPAVPLGA